jgi:hypothetical protein
MQPVYFLIIGIHEGGFRFVVGRAGIMTERPYSIWIYLSGRSILPWRLDSPWKRLRNKYPQRRTWTSAVVYHAFSHPVLGDGRMYAFFPFPFSIEDGITLSGRGVMVFGNIDVDGHPLKGHHFLAIIVPHMTGKLVALLCRCQWQMIPGYTKCWYASVDMVGLEVCIIAYYLGRL